MDQHASLPSVRACIFDMDGLLINSEDIYARCEDMLLEKYGKGPLPWSIKAQLQGRPGPVANELFYSWAQLPVTPEEYFKEKQELWAKYLPESKPLPGVAELLHRLDATRHCERQSDVAAQMNPEGTGPHRLHLALATSSQRDGFRLKTDHLQDLFSVFAPHRRILGDDARLGRGRGKPLPDIFLLALKTINESLSQGERPIRPIECLVFEDSLPGVEAGRRAGMRVVWCPHPSLREEFRHTENGFLAGELDRDGSMGSQAVNYSLHPEAMYISSLEEFPFERFQIAIPSAKVS
ncbi:hypothetical protein ACJZ2D_005954 [Fusarium nematophilum]